MFTCTPGSSASLVVGAYSDSGFTNPITEGDALATVYLKSVPTDFTPIAYLFFYEDVNGDLWKIYHGANDNTSWTITNAALGAGSVYCIATEDGDNWIGNDLDFEVTGVPLLMDDFTFIWGVSNVLLRTAFVSPLVNFRRSSDNATADFSTDIASTPIQITGNSIASNSAPSSHDGSALSTFAAAMNAFSPKMYDHSVNGNDASQTTVGNQPQGVSGGVLFTIGGNAAFDFNGTSMHLNGWINALAPASFQSLGTSITIIAKVNADAVSASSGAVWLAAYTIIDFRQMATTTSKVPFLFGIDNSKLHIGVASNGNSAYEIKQSTATLTTATDYVLAVTINGNTVKLYINGALDSTHTLTTATGTRNVSTTNSSLRVGARTTDALASTSYLNGRLSSLAISDQVLTDAQILDIYNNYPL